MRIKIGLNPKYGREVLGAYGAWLDLIHYYSQRVEQNSSGYARNSVIGVYSQMVLITMIIIVKFPFLEMNMDASQL
jgi:hypothetical protein